MLDRPLRNGTLMIYDLCTNSSMCLASKFVSELARVSGQGTAPPLPPYRSVVQECYHPSLCVSCTLQHCCVLIDAAGKLHVHTQTHEFEFCWTIQVQIRGVTPQECRHHARGKLPHSLIHQHTPHLHACTAALQEDSMALPTLQQHQQLISQEPSSCSWLKDNNSNNNSTDNNRHHSSAPPPQGVCATTRTGPREPRSPFHDPAAHHRPEYQPTTPQHHHHHHSAATATSTFFAGGAARAPTATDDASGYSGDGPLSFPAPKFSSALKIAEADGSFTLVSQTTRRRWSVVDSSRDCQFGEVLRAVELTEEDAVPSAYFAIKVLYVPILFCCCFPSKCACSKDLLTSAFFHALLVLIWIA